MRPSSPKRLNPPAHDDEWPPPYEYRGRTTAWTRIARNAGRDPARHRHACPNCYEHKWCELPCTLEPDLEEEDGTPCGSHMICAECEREMEIIDTSILAGEPRAPTKEDMEALERAGQLVLDLGA